MLRTLLFVAIGGSIGSMLRYLTTAIVDKYFGSFFPLATFIINIVGCFLIGITVSWLEKNQMMNSNFNWLLVTGFCGGFTTFSAFGYENIRLLQSGHLGIAFLYILSSIILSLGAVWLGLLLVK
jgi:CrcB protein